MRIVTLLPAATELVAALGAAEELVAISHECDFPAEVLDRPRITSSRVGISQRSARIDEAVRRLHDDGRPVIAVDAWRLRELAPDIIVTQGLCDVCAVADGEVLRLAGALPHPPAVLTLAGRDLEGVFADVRMLGAALDRTSEAERLLADARHRLRALQSTSPARAPRVLCVEWLDPPYLAGHWVPELVRHAGGSDVGARAGEHSRVAPWSELVNLAPDVVLVMLCGFGLARAREELAAVTDPDALALLGTASTWLLDGNAYTSRPGPRLVDAAEHIQAALLGRAAAGVEPWRVEAVA